MVRSKFLRLTASAVETAVAIASPLWEFIIKSNLKLDVDVCVLTKGIVTIMSSFYIVLLAHGSERCALQKQENIIVLILDIEKQAWENWFEAGSTWKTWLQALLSAGPAVPAKGWALKAGTFLKQVFNRWPGPHSFLTFSVKCRRCSSGMISTHVVILQFCHVVRVCLIQSISLPCSTMSQKVAQWVGCRLDLFLPWQSLEGRSFSLCNNGEYGFSSGIWQEPKNPRFGTKASVTEPGGETWYNREPFASSALKIGEHKEKFFKPCLSPSEKVF